MSEIQVLKKYSLAIDENQTFYVFFMHFSILSFSVKCYDQKFCKFNSNKFNH